jgi:nucleoid-associated protein YgaU
MKRLHLLMLLISALVLSGCVARTYPLTRDRIDQDLSTGNRGFISGTAPVEDKIRDEQRTVRVFEIEIGKPYKAKCNTDSPIIMQDNRVSSETNYTQESSLPEATMSTGSFEKYTVGKNDTLQKISQKFYGTTKKWNKIYEANRDTLKTPDRVYPGQVLNIPEEGMRKSSEALIEPKENLK